MAARKQSPPGGSAAPKQPGLLKPGQPGYVGPMTTKPSGLPSWGRPGTQDPSYHPMTTKPSGNLSWGKPSIQDPSYHPVSRSPKPAPPPKPGFVRAGPGNDVRNGPLASAKPLPVPRPRPSQPIVGDLQPISRPGGPNMQGPWPGLRGDTKPSIAVGEPYPGSPPSGPIIGQLPRKGPLTGQLKPIGGSPGPRPLPPSARPPIGSIRKQPKPLPMPTVPGVGQGGVGMPGGMVPPTRPGGIRPSSNLVMRPGQLAMGQPRARPLLRRAVNQLR